MGCIRALVKHLVGLLAFITWAAGSVIIAYTLWVLATSANAKNFFLGTLPVIYVLLVLGGLFIFNGLLGWMGSYRKGGCMLKMFLFLCVLTIAAEIGGIISLSILKTKVGDIVTESWNEMNLKSRSFVQEQLSCCGLNGPSEYAKITDPIPESCYVKTSPRQSPGSSTPESAADPNLHENGCRTKILSWLDKQKLILIAGFGGFLLFQVFTVLLTVSAINGMKSRSSSMESLEEPHTYM